MFALDDQTDRLRREAARRADVFHMLDDKARSWRLPRADPPPWIQGVRIT